MSRPPKGIPAEVGMKDLNSKSNIEGLVKKCPKRPPPNPESGPEQATGSRIPRNDWIPASAGMTGSFEIRLYEIIKFME